MKETHIRPSRLIIDKCFSALSYLCLLKDLVSMD